VQTTIDGEELHNVELRGGKRSANHGILLG